VGKVNSLLNFSLTNINRGDIINFVSKEKDILHFKGERWVFGIKDDSDDGEYYKGMPALLSAFGNLLIANPYHQ